MAAATDTPLYNSRIFDSYLKLLKKRYPQVDIPDLLGYARMKVCEIADQGHWFSQDQVNLFHERLVQLTGDPGIAREAGRYAASPDALGPLRYFLMGLIGPEYLFVIVNRLAAKLSRSCRCNSRKVGPRELELTVTFEEGVQENPRQCENRIGFIEAAFLFYGQASPEIVHTDCLFKGAQICRYRIRWQPSLSSRLILARRISFFLLCAAGIAFVWVNNPLLGPLFFTALLLHLGLAFLSDKFERKSLLAALGNMRTSSERLLTQVQENYDNALMINEIGEVISKKIELDEIVSSVNQVLQKRLNYGRGLILLADRERSALMVKGSFGFGGEAEQTLELMEYPLDTGSRGLLVRCFHSQEPLLVNRLSDVEGLALPKSYAFFAELGVNSFICVPIICEGESLGILAVDDVKREGELLQSDLNLIQGVAQVIGIAVSNSLRFKNERELSEQLRKAAELLERRVEERTAELTLAQEGLEFLYDSVSHDLRTPLRVIYGYSELLLEGHAQHLDQTATEYIQSMIRGGEQMEATLDRMLDFSEVRLKELKMQSVDLSALANRIVLDLRVMDKNRAVSVQIQEDVVVTGDEGLLKSVMENLLGNAWKYSAAKADSSVSFGMQDGICYVSDNGDGFDMALAERLFKPFQRLHQGNNFTGHGLGLALVQRIIERLGGRVWGAGRPGEGATFYFTVSGAASLDEAAGTVSGGES